MTPERSAYYNSMSQEEYEDRVMVLFLESSITSWKKKLNKFRAKPPSNLETIRLCKAMIRVYKKKLIKAKKKLPNRKAEESEVTKGY